jgi:hypothetical protein
LLSNAESQALAHTSRKSLQSTFPKPGKKGEEDAEYATLVMSYMGYANGLPDVKDVDVKKADGYVRRVLHVMDYIPLSPPDDAYLASNKDKVMSLLFATDPEYVSFLCIMTNCREITEVTAAIGQSLASFIMQVTAPTTPNTKNIPACLLAYRFVGLARFRRDGLCPPENMAWLFLFLHQLVYEKTALKFPTEAGLAGKSKQQIQTRVNNDIKALSDAKFGKDTLSKNDRSNNKVHPLFCR